MAEIARLLRREAIDNDVGFTYREFCLAYCKCLLGDLQALPPATAATVDQGVWDDAGSMPHTTAFMQLVQQCEAGLVLSESQTSISCPPNPSPGLSCSDETRCKVLDMNFPGWFYDSLNFKREEQSHHDFSLLGNGPDVADAVFLESLMNDLEPFDSYVWSRAVLS